MKYRSVSHLRFQAVVCLLLGITLGSSVACNRTVDAAGQKDEPTATTPTEAQGSRAGPIAGKLSAGPGTGKTPGTCGTTDVDCSAAVSAQAVERSLNAPAVEPDTRIGRIVFLDKENCCNCTRTRQDATWANLQEALRDINSKPDVEVVHVDTQGERAGEYRDLEPTMVTPGMYFFDQDDAYLELLQGDISTDQIRRMLK